MTGVYAQLAECGCALAEARLVEARLAFAKVRDAVSDAERAVCGGGGRLPLS